MNISEDSDVEECSEDDGDEVYDDVIIPPYALNINATITKVRNIVRMFRKSPLKSETLKKYINEHLEKNLNLILVCKTVEQLNFHDRSIFKSQKTTV